MLPDPAALRLSCWQALAVLEGEIEAWTLPLNSPRCSNHAIRPHYPGGLHRRIDEQHLYPHNIMPQ